MRTFSRETFVESKAAWEAGEFSKEWEPYRAQAAERGFIYPPEGSRWDLWEDEEPSQRAIIYRAIEDTPRALTTAIGQSRSWFEVVRKLMADLERRREDADLAERELEWNSQYEPTPRQSTRLLADILGRIRDSAA